MNINQFWSANKKYNSKFLSLKEKINIELNSIISFHKKHFAPDFFYVQLLPVSSSFEGLYWDP